MFLAELQPEEKIAFLELAAQIARIDGNLSIYENSILNRYQREMDLEDYQIKGVAIDEILNTFKNDRSKNIVLTELLQLIYSDGVMHNHENETVHLIKKHFGFAENEYSSYKDWIDKIKELSASEQ
jgi:uncharacterized tellurite resistance protein B-like protein